MSSGFHQPPDPAELRRVPPRSGACARVRGLLRDYADGDLQPAEAASVDQHVQGCRECGLALSRAEFETHRLRQCLAGTVVSPPAGFASRTVESLLRDQALEPGASTLPAARRGPNLRLGRTERRLLWTVTAVAALLAIGALLRQGYAELGAASRMVVLDAFQAHGSANGRRLELGPGDGLDPRTLISVGAGGFADLEWNDATTGHQPAASLRLHGDTQLRVNGDQPLLVEGQADISSHRPFTLALSDGSRIEFGAGSYHIEATDLRLRDGWLASLNVEVEVAAGGPARVVAPNGASQIVNLGQSAQWGGGDLRLVDAGPRGGLRQPAPGGGPSSQPQPDGPSLHGQVLELPGGGPALRADVVISFLEGGRRASAQRITDLTGRFELPAGRQVDGDFAVVYLKPDRARRDLGCSVPEPVRISRGSGTPEIPIPLGLWNSPPLEGTVLDASDQPLAEVQVVPCVVDELFGLVFSIVRGGARSDSLGRFRLEQLPTSLQAHQRLGLLLLHNDHQSAFVPVPTPGSPAARALVLDLRLEGLQPVEVDLRSLALGPGNAIVLEELPGLPAGSAVRAHNLTIDRAGMGALSWGGGRLWLQRAEQGSLLVLPLALQRVGELLRARPEGGSALQRDVVRDQLDNVDGIWWLAFDFRYQAFLPAHAYGCRVQVNQRATNLPAPDAQVFRVAAAGVATTTPHFLGLFDGSLPLATEAVQAEDLLIGLNAEGSLGLAQPGSANGGPVTVVLDAVGAAVLGEGLRPDPQSPQQAVAVEFAMLDGPNWRGRQPAVRFAAAGNEWRCEGLLPGRYRATVAGSRTLLVQIRSGETSILQ